MSEGSEIKKFMLKEIISRNDTKHFIDPGENHSLPDDRGRTLVKQKIYQGTPVLKYSLKISGASGFMEAQEAVKVTSLI